MLIIVYFYLPDGMLVDSVDDSEHGCGGNAQDVIIHRVW